ncbi:MAG: hypothetical protein HC820_00550, partial [Hydrococcus sp. RM1_1_31]|nr:hypothetical protein [Hydrococcus sp. RM1_1_31]
EGEGYSVKEVATGNKTNPDLPLSWEQISLDEASEVANAELLSDRELDAALAIDSPPPELLPRIRKTLLLKRYGEKIVDAIAYDFRVGKEGEIHHLTGFEALYLKDKNEKWYGKLKQAYYLIAGKEEAIAADYAREKEQLWQTEHFLEGDRHKRRYAGDVTWNARKREARRFIGLHKFLDADTWHEPGDFKLLKSKAAKFAFNFLDATAIDPSNPNLSVTQFYEALVEQLGLEVDKSEWKTELVFDGQGQPVLNKDGTQKRRKYKLRRINSNSWKLFELFCEHRQKQVASGKSQIASDSVPASSENLYQTGGGWNRTQAQTEQRVEVDFEAGKLDAMTTTVTPNIDESLASTNTQTNESSDVPTTPKNLSENEEGWNRNQTQTEKGIEGDFKEGKFELTDEEIQACLKELRQVTTADDYWELNEQCPRLLTQAWNRLNFFEQLRLQQICDEGIDPLAKWKEGDRCLLWHPFAQNEWGLATIKQVVTGSGGLIYALRDDGFGLHLGRDKLHLIELI